MLQAAYLLLWCTPTNQPLSYSNHSHSGTWAAQVKAWCKHVRVLTRRLQNFPTYCHMQWMTVVQWAVSLSATEWSETTAYQTTNNCGGPIFCPRDLCSKEDLIMGPRACSILGSKGRFFAYGIRRENNDMDLISKQASKHASTQTSKQTSKQARGQGNHRWLSCPKTLL